MAKPTKRSSRKPAAAKPSAGKPSVGEGGELHQTSRSTANTLTTNQGVAISDNQNTLKSGARGPSLLVLFAEQPSEPALLLVVLSGRLAAANVKCSLVAEKRVSPTHSRRRVRVGRGP